MQRWFVSSLSEIVIVVLEKVRQKNEMFYSSLEHVILHVHSIFAIAHLPPEVILQDQAKIRTLNFQGHSKYYIHNIFKTLAYVSSNLTQNGSCIRNLPSLTLKTPPLSLWTFHCTPNLFWNFWKKTTPWILAIKYLQLLINLIHNLTKFLHTQTIHSTITWESL